MTPTHAGLPRSFTRWSLLGLAGGVAFGLVGHRWELASVDVLAGIVAPFGRVWVNALRMTVIPLLVCQMLTALVDVRDGTRVGRLGAQAFGLFLVILFSAGTLTYLITGPLLGLYRPDPAVVAALSAEVTPDLLGQAGARMSLADWLTGIVPTNVAAAAVRGDLLPLLVFTVLFGLATRRLPTAQRRPLGALFRALNDAVMTLVVWILHATPFALFAILLGVALDSGMRSVGALGVFVVMMSGVLLVITVLLYPVTVAFGRTSLTSFARAVLPAQLVAASTRSSIASLPALIEGGEEHLDLPPSATGFVLPICVSTFKVNQAVSTTFRVMFLTYLVGVPFGPWEMATFLVTAIVISFSVAGIPQGGPGLHTLPAYLAAGVPLELYIVFETVIAIPDIFMTVLNVTGDMSVATMLSRRGRGPVRVGRASGHRSGAGSVGVGSTLPT